MDQLSSLPITDGTEPETHPKFLSKEEFDYCYNSGFSSQEKEIHENSIPWEIKNFEFCEVDSIPKILSTTQNHFLQENEDNNPKNELANIFEEIMNFSDDEDSETIGEVAREIESDDSSIMSSEDEESEKPHSKVIEVDFSTSC